MPSPSANAGCGEVEVWWIRSFVPKSGVHEKMQTLIAFKLYLLLRYEGRGVKNLDTSWMLPSGREKVLATTSGWKEVGQVPRPPDMAIMKCFPLICAVHVVGFRQQTAADNIWKQRLTTVERGFYVFAVTAHLLDASIWLGKFWRRLEVSEKRVSGPW